MSLTLVTAMILAPAWAYLVGTAVAAVRSWTEHRLVQCRDEKRRQVFLRPTARVAGLALLEAVCSGGLR